MEATLIDKTAPPPMVGSVLHQVGSGLQMVGVGLWSHERDVSRVAELGTSKDIAIFMT